MIDGAIVRSGGPELAEALEAGGYERIRQELGLTTEPPPAPPPRT